MSAANMSAFNISPNIRSYFKGMSKGATYVEEAEFGLRRILPVIASLPAGSRVLEIGSGPCILLAEITERFPQLIVQGVEPMSDGFAFFDDFIQRMSAAHCRLNVHLGGYENFNTNRTWDLIFLVNVFEHLPDWRAFLDFVARSLAPDGSCVILCPNYGFPYESHFRLPVVINKRLTGALFRRRIEQFERENDAHGLYRSLNFVRLRQVRYAARSKRLKLHVNTTVIREMIDRLQSDRAFQKRQGIFALPALVLKGTGLLDMLMLSPLVQDFLPYMQITLRKDL